MKSSKTILITGASSGIGRSTVEVFSEKGWRVAATMRDPGKSQELAKLPGVKLYPLDVTDIQSIHACIEAVTRDFGKIDVLLNNAGYGAVGVFEAASPEQVQKQFDTNVFGVMNVTRAILPHFRKNRSGRILTISSVGGRVTFPIYSLYHSTKWAVEGFMESLHYELRPLGIQAKLIEPGPIKTDFYGRSQDLHLDKIPTDYKSYFDIAYSNSKKAGMNAEGPQVVANMIFKAATDSKNKLRYPVGGNAPALIAIKRYLSERLFFKIVRSTIEKGL